MSCIHAWVDLYPDQDEFYVCLTDFTAENMKFGDYQEYQVDLKLGMPPPPEKKRPNPVSSLQPSNQQKPSITEGQQNYQQIIGPLQSHRELLVSILQNSSTMENCRRELTPRRSRHDSRVPTTT